MVNICSASFCLTKDYDDNISSNKNCEQNSNAIDAAEMIFPSYGSICSGIEDEQQTAHNDVFWFVLAIIFCYFMISVAFSKTKQYVTVDGPALYRK